MNPSGNAGPIDRSKYTNRNRIVVIGRSSYMYQLNRSEPSVPLAVVPSWGAYCHRRTVPHVLVP